MASDSEKRSSGAIAGFIKLPTARRILKPFFYAYPFIFVSKMASHKLKHQVDKGDEIESLVEVASSFEYKQILKAWSASIRPLQVKSELVSLCRIAKESNPKVIVEIGTANGGTLFLFAHVTKAERIISVDLPSGSFGGGYPYWKIPFFKSMGKKHVIHLIRADSHSEETRAKIQSKLEGRKVDFLFIDGDHTYQGVKQDFQMYSPLVEGGGIVAFHDVAKHDSAAGCEVDKFWNEIKQKYKHLEIIEDQNQKWAGIGVLFL